MQAKACSNLFHGIKQEDLSEDKTDDKKMGIQMFKEMSNAIKSGREQCHKLTDLMLDAEGG